MSRRLVAAVFALSLFATPVAARAAVGFVPDLNLFPSGPSMQFDDGGLSFIPKGIYSSEPWEAPVVLGQFAASAAVNVGAVFLFNHLASGEDQSDTEAENALLLWGLVQFAATPLVSATSVWAVGSLSNIHSVSFGWPLLVNYVADLVLTAAKIGLGFGLVNLKGSSELGGMKRLLGPYIIVDLLLRGILIPATTTYFSIRSRDAKGYDFSANEAPIPAYAMRRPSFRSVAEQQEESTRGPGVVQLSIPLLAVGF